LLAPLVLATLAASPAEGAETPVGFHAGSVLRFVALHPEQVRSGLRDVNVFYGLAAGIDRGRLEFAGEVTTGGAVARFGIDGVSDPEVRIWSVTGALHVRPQPEWPLYALGGGGFWRLDYRPETVLLAFPGIEPIGVALADVNAPLLTAGAGIALDPHPWLRLGVEGGVLGLRLNEARLDGAALQVEPHWRVSPTMAARVEFAF
jgi:hypothetical protein